MRYETHNLNKKMISSNVSKISSIHFNNIKNSIEKEITNYLSMHFLEIKNDLRFKQKVNEILLDNFSNSSIRLDDDLDKSIFVETQIYEKYIQDNNLEKILKYEIDQFDNKIDSLKKNTSYFDFSTRTSNDIVEEITKDSKKNIINKGTMKKQITSIIDFWLNELVKKTGDSSKDALVPELMESQKELSTSLSKASSMGEVSKPAQTNNKTLNLNLGDRGKMFSGENENAI